MSNDVLPHARESEKERERARARRGHARQVENYLFLVKIMNEPFRLQGKQRQRRRERGRKSKERSWEAQIGNCEQVTATPK